MHIPPPIPLDLKEIRARVRKMVARYRAMRRVQRGIDAFLKLRDGYLVGREPLRRRKRGRLTRKAPPQTDSRNTKHGIRSLPQVTYLTFLTYVTLPALLATCNLQLATAATVIGNLTDISIQALDTKLIFTPTNNVLVTGTGLSAGPPVIIESAGGAFSLVLESGDYTVSLPLIPWRRPFVISVFNTNGIVNITNLLASPQTYTYTNNLNYSVKATPDDAGLDVLGAKLDAAAGLIKTTNVASGVATIVLGIPTNAELKVLSLAADGPQNNYDWTAVSNGVVAVAAWNTGHGMVRPPGVYFFNTNGNVTGSLETWADHGSATDTPEMIIKSMNNLALSPGGNGVADSRVQLGLSQSDHAQFYLQYDDDPTNPGFNDGLTAYPIGHSKRLGFAARAGSAEAMPGIIGITGGTTADASLGPDYTLLGELRFYSLIPQWTSGSFASKPGVWVGSMKTNGWDLRGKLIQEQKVTTSASYQIDFNSAAGQVVDASAASVTFTTANLPTGATNYQKVELMIRSGPYTVTPTFPAWKWGNEAGSAAAPASLASQKLLAIHLRALGNTDASVLASYSIHPWPFAYDTDADAFFTRASISDDTQKLALNQLVLAAKAHGWWTLCDVIYPFVGGNATAHSKNLRANTFNIAWHGTVTHNANGVTGDGSTGYGDTGYVPSTAGGVMTANSAHLLAYCGTTVPADAGRAIGILGANGNRLGLYKTSPYWYGEGVNVSASGALLIDVVAGFSSDWRGPVLASRTGSAAQAIYFQTSSMADTTGSPGLPNSAGGADSGGLYVLGKDDGGLYQAFNGNLRGASIGAGIDSSTAALMRADWDNFENVLGRKVP